MEELANDCGYDSTKKTLRCDFNLQTFHGLYAMGTITYEVAQKMFSDIVASENHYVEDSPDKVRKSS